VKVRRRARVVALQALFEIDSVNHDLELVLKLRLANTPLPSKGSQFASQLVRGVIAHRPELDRLISKKAPEWPIEQMAIIDRNVLRMAIFEMAIDRGTPAKDRGRTARTSQTARQAQTPLIWRRGRG